MNEAFDIAIIGGGISGFSAALRLQAQGYKTLVLEAHGQLGGCAGFFTKKGFSFDVGATTLVDFIEGGIGGNFFKDINLALPKGEYIDYKAWLPDRQITLYRDRKKWNAERLEKVGSSKNHIEFWKLMDKVTDVFWEASRKGIKLPIQSFSDILLSIKSIGFKNLPLARYMNFTMTDVLKKFHLENDAPLIGLLSILIEDTVHSTIDKAPFINAALGTTIRGAGLLRAEGGMKKFWDYISTHYVNIGGTIKRGNKVLEFQRKDDAWAILTNKGNYKSKKIISSLPLELTQKIAPDDIRLKLDAYIKKNVDFEGSAIVVFLGIPDCEISDQELTHHQMLHNYEKGLGNGNNMFISISSKGDLFSAPNGYRSMMISTHCEIAEWQNLSEDEYLQKKKSMGEQLLQYARKIYPHLAENPIVYEIGTPLTYQKFTQRLSGSVGGFKQNLKNTNLNAVPQDIGVKNFWLVGDNTWPGLGTVAGLIGSKIVTYMVAEKKK